MKTNEKTAADKTLSPELLDELDAYWRAANYLSVGHYDNPCGVESVTTGDARHAQGLHSESTTMESVPSPPSAS